VAMRLEDIQLRDAARRGDAQACLAMAERLFGGKGGFSRNYTLGLAYLQQELNRKTPAALLLLGDLVPLDLILTQQLLPYLRDAADMGSCLAMLKLGTLLSLRAETRGEGAQMIRRSRISDGFADGPQPHDPGVVLRFLKALAPEVVNPTELALWGARSALKEQSVERACYFIAIATDLMPPNRKLAEIVFSTVQLAAKSHTALSLPVDLVEYSLQACSASGEVEAQYGLGCAFAGIPYGKLAPQRIARSRNFEKAATLLLRAADAGKCQAWLNLSEIVPSYRSALSSKGIARFFLEKAALAGLLEAQTKLGAALLTEAASLENAEEGIRWLGIAAEKSCPTALELLQTLVLPLPELPSDYEKSMIQRIAAMDPELGVRVSLARSLHLTRREAMNFNAKRDIKTWGLLIPGASYENPKGRLAPVVSPEMRSEVQRTSEFFAASSPIENTLLGQRSRAQRHIFKLLSISETVFFASEIGRSLSHYGYGRHWAGRSAPVLQKLRGDAVRACTDSHDIHLTHQQPISLL
jgi:TPR repeat protein